VRFLIDADVYGATRALLAAQGHDLLYANSTGISNPRDIELLKEARAQNRIMITRDRDFGNLVFAQHFKTGVIYLRMDPGTIQSVHTELLRILSLYDETRLLGSFTVVEPGMHRIRGL
jgi:predicted nuclease of predicted toxin-antitoxin system